MKIYVRNPSWDLISIVYMHKKTPLCLQLYDIIGKLPHFTLVETMKDAYTRGSYCHLLSDNSYSTH